MTENVRNCLSWIVRLLTDLPNFLKSKFLKKGDKVREIGDTLTGTIDYIANGYADVKYPNMKGVCSLPVQFLEKV